MIVIRRRRSRGVAVEEWRKVEKKGGGGWVD